MPPIVAARAPDARDSIQFGDAVQFRAGRARQLFGGTVTGWHKGGLVISCTDGIARRVEPNAAWRVA